MPIGLCMQECSLAVQLPSLAVQLLSLAVQLLIFDPVHLLCYVYLIPGLIPARRP